VSIYSKLRTPKFEVEIAYKATDDFVALPPQLLRLIEKIEITETLGDLCENNCVATLVFREGSREPYVHEGNLETDNIYGVDHIFSNTTGMLSDLVFDFSSKNSIILK
jgi:hypothetical protein